MKKNEIAIAFEKLRKKDPPPSRKALHAVVGSRYASLMRAKNPRLYMPAAYIATEFSSRSTSTQPLLAAMRADGGPVHRVVEGARIIRAGLFHGEVVIDRDNCHMARSGAGAIEQHWKDIRDLIVGPRRALIELGVGLAHDLRLLSEKCEKNPPGVIIALDKSAESLQAAEKVAKDCGAEFYGLNCDFFQDPWQKHAIWKELRKHEIPLTFAIFGGTQYNQRESERMPLLKKIRRCMWGKDDAFIESIDPTYHAKTLEDTYWDKSYPLFYRLGIHFGNTINTWHMDQSCLRYDPQHDAYGVVTGFDHTRVHDLIMPEFGKFIRSFEPGKDWLTCTIAEKPSLEHVAAERKRARMDFQKPFYQYEDPHCPNSLAGIGISRPALSSAIT